MTVIHDRRDGINQGVALKAPVRVATTANITLSGEQTIDSIAVVADDRVLVKNQTDTTENGIWIVSTGAWTRAKDFNGSRDSVKGTLVPVSEGTKAGRMFRVTTSNGSDGYTAIGTANITFAEEFEYIVWRGAWSAGTYNANDAVSHEGNSWIATAETTEEPTGSPTDWDKMAAKGDTGNDGSVEDLSGVATGTVDFAADYFIWLDATDGVTKKSLLGTAAGASTGDFLNPRVQSVVSAATVTPTNLNDEVVVTAQAEALTIANPTGTMVQGQALIIRLKDDGTGRAITWGSAYRAVGVTLPTTTTASKTLYVAAVWNATDSKFDVMGVSEQA